MAKQRRRGRGEGSIYKDSRGRWVAVLDTGTDAKGKRQRQRFIGKRYEDVRDRLRKAQREHEEGRKTDGGRKLTVSELMDQFVEYELVPNSRTEKTAEGHRWAAGHIKDGLGARKLAELGYEDIRGWLTELAERNWARSSLVAVLSRLKRALRWAQQRRIVAENPAELVTVPHARRREGKSLTVEQAEALIAAASGHRLEALILLGLHIPARPGELLGLTWNDVDLDSGVLTFHRALRRESQPGHPLVLGPLKTEQSRRSIQLEDQSIIDALKRRRAIYRREKLSAGSEWQDFATEHGGLVFGSEYGGPTDPANMRRLLKGLAYKAGLGDNWTVYELRFSAISLRSDRGERIEDIADLAGHRNSYVTSTVYRKVLSPTLRSGKSAIVSGEPEGEPREAEGL